METHENAHSKLNEDFLKEYSAEENNRRHMKETAGHGISYFWRRFCCRCRLSGHAQDYASKISKKHIGIPFARRLPANSRFGLQIL